MGTKRVGLVVALAFGLARAEAAPLTIAAVDSPETRAIEALSAEWEAVSGHKLEWQFIDALPITRWRTADQLAALGRFDVVTLDAATIREWGADGRLLPLPAGDDRNVDGPMWAGQSAGGAFYGVPYAAETALTYYAVGLFDALGLAMPTAPTLAELSAIAAALEAADIDGSSLCLAAGNAEDSLAVLTLLAHALGDAELDHPDRLADPEGNWRTALALYRDLGRTRQPSELTTADAATVARRFADGECAVWIAGSRWMGPLGALLGPDRADALGVALAPGRPSDGSVGWLHAMSFAIPRDTAQRDAAMDFVAWASAPELAQRAVAVDRGASGIVAARAGNEGALKEQSLPAAFARLLEAMRHAVPAGLDALPALSGDDRAAIAGLLGGTIVDVVAGRVEIDAGLDAMASASAGVVELPLTRNLGPSLASVRAARLFAGPGQFPPKNFAAYGIVAFPEEATSADRARHEMLCEAYTAALLPSDILAERLNVPPERQMVTVWPIDDDEIASRLDSREIDEPCTAAVERYDLVTAQLSIAEAGPERIGRIGRGPYLLAWSPTTAKGAPDAVVLIADLSNVTLPEHARDVFRIWRRDIESNPALWNRGWDVERLRVEIRMLADRFGESLFAVLGI